MVSNPSDEEVFVSAAAKLARAHKFDRQRAQKIAENLRGQASPYFLENPPQSPEESDSSEDSDEHTA